MPMSWISRPIFPRPLAADGPLTDAFLDSYVCWREACEDVGSAYRRWETCEPPERTLAYDGYRAALDREEHAAHIHSDRTARLRAAQR
jgi:hypothetical protein